VQTSLITGIAASIQTHPHRNTRLILDKSESDIEFSSDCLPIKTDSSSILDPSSLLKGVEDSVESGCLSISPAGGEQFNEGDLQDELSPTSPLTEIPPTPTLTNTHEVSESDGDEQSDLSTELKATLVDNSVKRDTEVHVPSKEAHVPFRQREIDPVREETIRKRGRQTTDSLHLPIDLL